VEIYCSLPNNKNIDSLKFRLSVAQGLMKKNKTVPVFLILYISIQQLNHHQNDSQKNFLEHIHACGKEAKPQ
jgi:hypothetical protein